MRRRLPRSALLTAAVLLTAAAATPAVAAPAPAAGTGRHCVADLGSGGEHCFTTFTDAIAFASGGRVADAPASAADAAASTELRGELRSLAKDAAGTAGGTGTAEAALADGVIQGTFFEDAQYGGSSLTITGEAPCKKDGWVNYQYDFEDDWKNRVSSVQPWANCWLWLYPEPGLNGDRDGPFQENTPDIGSFMNDRAQSVGFS